MRSEQTGEIAMTEVRAMCAIGRRGQLGLGSRMPWEGDKGPEFVADVQRFFAMTQGHVIAAGPKTIASIPAFARESRTVFELRSQMAPEEVIARFPGRVVFIGGGPPVWAAYAHLIRIWDITILPYDGEADRWFDPAWLVGSGAPLPAA
jgi:dihydromethanopterin reductase